MDVTSTGPGAVTRAGTWSIPTERPQPAAGESCAGPSPSGCANSGHRAPTAFSAEMALDGAIDKNIVFLLPSARGLVALPEGLPQRMP